MYSILDSEQILDRWFESEPLKATIATDAVIGAMLTPDQPGSGYVPILLKGNLNRLSKNEKKRVFDGVFLGKHPVVFALYNIAFFCTGQFGDYY